MRGVSIFDLLDCNIILFSFSDRYVHEENEKFYSPFISNAPNYRINKRRNLSWIQETIRFLKGKRHTFKGDNSIKIILLPSEKGFTLKGKNLLPKGSKFFPFRVNPFSEGIRYAGK